MGKSVCGYIENRVFAIRKYYGPPAEFSRTHRTIGLAVCAGPIVVGWLAPYAADLIPGYLENDVAYHNAEDVLLLAGLLVLGGDFSDKLRALVTHGAGGCSQKRLDERMRSPCGLQRKPTIVRTT